MECYIFFLLLYFFLTCRFSCCRNGRGHEEGGQARPGADRRGEEPAVRRLQERDWRQEGVVAHHLLHRAEGGVEGHRRQAGNDTPVQVAGGEGAQGHLFGHPWRAGQTSDPGRVHGRVQGLLLQNEGEGD